MPLSAIFGRLYFISIILIYAWVTYLYLLPIVSLCRRYTLLLVCSLLLLLLVIPFVLPPEHRTPGISTVSIRPCQVEEACALDFVADTGDGWDSTFTVVAAIVQPLLNVSGVVLNGSRILFHGGDLVYPRPTLKDFEKRFHEPYAIAFNYKGWQPPFPASNERPRMVFWLTQITTMLIDRIYHMIGNHPRLAPLPPLRDKTNRDPMDDPELWAIPGNHDALDGGALFSRVFVDQDLWSTFGGWTMPQNGSYFVVSRCQGWFLIAISDQQAAGENPDIDSDQYTYLLTSISQHLQQENIFQQGRSSKKALLFMHSPFWLLSKEPGARLQRFLALLKDAVSLRAIIAGDLHYYAHHVPEDPSLPHLIVSGQGGAFLHSTWGVERNISVRLGAHMNGTYLLRQTYPRPVTSLKLLLQVWWYKPLWAVFLSTVVWFVLWHGRVQIDGVLLLLFSRWDVPISLLCTVLVLGNGPAFLISCLSLFPLYIALLVWSAKHNYFPHPQHWKNFLFLNLMLFVYTHVLSLPKPHWALLVLLRLIFWFFCGNRFLHKVSSGAPLLMTSLNTPCLMLFMLTSDILLSFNIQPFMLEHLPDFVTSKQPRSVYFSCLGLVGLLKGILHVWDMLDAVDHTQKLQTKMVIWANAFQSATDMRLNPGLENCESTLFEVKIKNNYLPVLTHRCVKIICLVMRTLTSPMLTWAIVAVFLPYLLVAIHYAWRFADDLLFSAMGIEEYKGFLRIHLSRNSATVYAIGLAKVFPFRILENWRHLPYEQVYATQDSSRWYLSLNGTLGEWLTQESLVLLNAFNV